MLHSRVQTPLSYMAAAAMMIIFKKDPTQCLYLSWLLLSLLLLWPLGHLRLASSAGRRATSHRKARIGAAGSASVFYICSSQFVEEKETLRVIYLRTISAVRGATVKSILNSSLMSGIMPLASLLLLFSSISQASFGIRYSHPIKKREEQSTKLPVMAIWVVKFPRKGIRNRFFGQKS